MELSGAQRVGNQGQRGSVRRERGGMGAYLSLHQRHRAIETHAGVLRAGEGR